MPILKLYEMLFDHYGPQNWWPCRSGERWEIIAGAILTQNTAWTNVEKAVENLEAALEHIENAQDCIAEAIA